MDNDNDSSTRSSELQKRVDAMRVRQSADESPKRGVATGYGMAIRLAVELVAALGVSVFLGLWLDREFETSPIFLIILLIMGMAAGFMNVYKVANGLTGGSLRGPAKDKEDRTRGR